ncbi:putative membrane protein YvbJ [Desulfofundulus luciae]|uniref:Membrane protein YvbJ n=1 Tax=Desulfofundulus luciae TaxID=74702 RepID=A0ABU0B4T6_9FIRM|nr:zinc-ribbon domain-containing protein [Desulfofundulus luciae]MDQ0287730.1 putative membrane protein YvbJ [Desulfofundulus luciae]
MFYCPECGTKIESGTKFCGNCGKPLNLSQVSKSQRQKLTESHVKIIVASVLVLIIGIALYLSLGKGGFLLTSSPETVAKAFVEGVIKGDKSVTRLCAGDDVAQAWNSGVMVLGLSMTKDRNFNYKVIRRTNKEAMVEVSGASGHLCTIELININGKWLVAYVY